MPTAREPRPRRLSLAGTTAWVVAVLVAINAAAIWGLVAARRALEESAHLDLELQATADARALEAVLATVRGDLALLSQSPPLSAALARLASEDPVARRWARLDVEATLVLFLSAHGGVERIEVQSGAGPAVARAGLVRGMPSLLPVEDAAPPAAGSELYRAAWPLPEARGGEIEVWLAPRRLLEQIGRGQAEGLWLELGDVRSPSAAAAAGGRLARVHIRDGRWRPPVSWTLFRTETGRLLRSVEDLTGRYRITVLLNVVVMSLTLVLGTVAYRQVRRAARLEAENEHQARMRDMERQLLHSERLASMGRLAAGVAHEINNPLEGMSNYLTLLEEDLAAGKPEDAADLVERVRDGVRRVTAITRQMLTLAHPGRAAEEPVDLAAQLHRVVDFVRSLPAYRHIRFEKDVPAEPVLVQGDSTTLGQLFLNLLMNAGAAQPGGGEVRVAARHDGARDRVEVEVADRGPGFSEEALRRAFEPFYSERGSTGLGLATCYRIVADHGGEIRAANRPGGGAVLEVSLPAAAPAPSRAAVLEEEP